MEGEDCGLTAGWGPLQHGRRCDAGPVPNYRTSLYDPGDAQSWVVIQPAVPDYASG